MNNKRILISGDKGFIGTHLSKKLKDLGHTIKGYDLKDGYDTRNETQVEKIIKNFVPQVIIHLAALTGVRKSVDMPKEYFNTNITGTLYLLKVAQKYGIKNFLFASSSSVYGDSAIMKEGTLCDHQLSPYAISKKTGELLCRMFDDLPTTVFRPFTVYGENGRKDMVVYKLIRAGIKNRVFQKYGEGSSRGYTNVHDLVEGIVKLIDYKPENNYNVFNLGGSEVIKLDDLIDMVKEEFPKLKVETIERNKADTKNNAADISKAKSIIGYKPVRDFRTNIKKLCQIYTELKE